MSDIRTASDDDRGRVAHAAMLVMRTPMHGLCWRALYIGGGVWLEMGKPNSVISSMFLDYWDVDYITRTEPDRFHWEDECRDQ